MVCIVNSAVVTFNIRHQVGCQIKAEHILAESCYRYLREVGLSG